MDGKVRVFLEKIEEVESFSGLSSLWIGSTEQTSEELIYSLQTYLREAEDKSEVNIETRPRGQDEEDEEDEEDYREKGLKPNPNFPINYFLNIEGNLYKAGDIKNIARGRGFKKGFNFWTVKINAHQTAFDLGFEAVVLRYATEELRLVIQRYSR